MHHTFMHAHIPNPKLMAETSTFGIFRGGNVHGQNVPAETSKAEMSVREMSEHPKGTVGTIQDIAIY